MNSCLNTGFSTFHVSRDKNHDHVWVNRSISPTDEIIPFTIASLFCRKINTLVVFCFSSKNKLFPLLRASSIPPSTSPPLGGACLLSQCKSVIWFVNIQLKEVRRRSGLQQSEKKLACFYLFNFFFSLSISQPACCCCCLFLLLMLFRCCYSYCWCCFAVAAVLLLLLLLLMLFCCCCSIAVVTLPVLDTPVRYLWPDLVKFHNFV